ncbi:MAG: hydrogenase maturation nickel metallochaperone HypA [Chloroflexi bacterium]|nr:hydrogenase maturation nickel metallochaperone HypA [Chloroflexota bacterium]
MHEVGLIADALERAVAAAESAGASRIDRLTFAARSDGHVTKETVEIWVDVLSRSTLAEGAEVVIEWSRLARRCRLCGGQLPVEAGVCRCGSSDLLEPDGPELELVCIDVPN